MEAKLKEYRALRRRKELIDNAKNKLEQSKEKIINFLTPKIFKDMGREREEEEVLLMEQEESPALEKPALEDVSEVVSEASEEESVEDITEESWRYFMFKWCLYAIIWLTMFIYFLKIQFGAVFFVISVLIGIYFNTRTKPKKKGEVSAYSVFNEDCVSIEGTLKAEELQRQLMFGAAPVRLF